MKALNLHAINDLRLDELPIPECRDDEVLVKIKYCGICGSDIPRVFDKGTYHFPTVIGHEFSGIVEYDPHKELEGKHVTVFPLLPCFECDSCKEQEYASCKQYDYYGSRRNGGMAEYLAVKRFNIVVLPDNVELDVGAMCEPISVAHHAVERLGDIKDKNVLISGAGPIGLTAGKWCMSRGAKAVYFFDIDSKKMDFAKSIGFFEYDQEEIGAAIEGTGFSQPLARCLSALTAGGKIVLMGNPSRPIELTQNEYWYILRKELTLLGMWNSQYGDIKNDWRASVAALANREIDVSNLITHKFKLEEYKEAFSLMRERKEFFNKVMFEL